MTHEQFITELASYKDLFAALVDADRDMWRALYKENDPEAEKALRNISEAAAAISKTADKMRVRLQTIKH